MDALTVGLINGISTQIVNTAVTEINQTITQVTNQVTSGIKSISATGSVLTFILGDDSIINIELTGLSDSNYSITEKAKLLSLNGSLLNRFTYATELLFDGQPIDGNVDLSNYYNKIEVDSKVSVVGADLTNHILDKTNPHDTEISNLKDTIITSPTDKQVLSYDIGTSKWKNQSVSISDEKVKATSTSTTAKFLDELIDNNTVVMENDTLIIKTIDGLTQAELLTLVGMDSNIKATISAISTGGMAFKGVVNTKAELNSIVGAVIGQLYIVLIDESQSNLKTSYIYNASWISLGESDVNVRDFSVNKIDLITEVKNILPKSNMDLTGIATIDDLENYETIADLQLNYASKTDLSSKVNAIDIVNDLISIDIDKPLSANQGKVLGELVNTEVTAINTELDTKLEASNIIAGSNITVEVIGNDITISSAGGSGGGTGVGIDDINISNTTTYSSTKIAELIGDTNDENLPITLQGQSLVDMVKVNFTNANEAKSQIIDAIGDVSLATTSSFAELSNDIISKKQDIVTALASKNIIATKGDSLETYADKISSIIQNSQIKNTKLNKLSGETSQIILTNPTTMQNISTSVLEHVAGATGVVQYTCDFNNADSSNFNISAGQHLVFDGKMKQENNIVSTTMVNEGLIGDYTTYSAPLDKSQFYKVVSVVKTTVGANEILTVNGVYSPTLVKPISDINLTGVDNISDIEWTATTTGTNKQLIIYSIDGGITWKGYDSVNHLVLNINNINDLSEVRSKGIGSAELNALTQVDLDNIKNGSIKIRFAYYIEKNSVDYTLENDKITLTVNMLGTDAFSSHYTVAFDGVQTLTYTFSANKTYTIVYTDNN